MNPSEKSQIRRLRLAGAKMLPRNGLDWPLVRFELVFLWCVSLGIQSPSENGFMEPKYLAFRR